MTSVAVLLSGCGHMDGAEIRESVLSLLYLDEMGAQVQIFAPDMPQRAVVAHTDGSVRDGQRNVLEEAARIARGQIAPLSALDPAQFDALVIPGGFGVARNLSDLAEKGAAATVHPDFVRVVGGFLQAGKPIGAICIAPAVVAAAAKGAGLTLTIGEDAGTAEAIAALGHTHQNSPTQRAVVDEKHRVASCSAYMRSEARLSDVAQGIRQVVESVISMAKTNRKAA